MSEEITAITCIVGCYRVFLFLCRHLNSRYPWFPDVKALTLAILSKTNNADPLCPEYPLSQFVLQYPRLKMGIDLLSSVVELYQWLHTELTYVVTYDDAAAITLGRLAKVTTKYLPDHNVAHYDKLKSKFNHLLVMCIALLLSFI